MDHHIMTVHTFTERAIERLTRWGAEIDAGLASADVLFPADVEPSYSDTYTYGGMRWERRVYRRVDMERDTIDYIEWHIGPEGALANYMCLEGELAS